MTSKRRSSGMWPWVATAGVLLAFAAALSLNLIPGLSLPSTLVSAGTSGSGDNTEPAGSQIPQAASFSAQAELAAREAEIERREQEVDHLLQELGPERDAFYNVQRMASVYAAMPPFKAGPALERLDQSLAAAILRELDDEQTAAVLAFMTPGRSAELTKLLLAPAEPLATITTESVK